MTRTVTRQLRDLLNVGACMTPHEYRQMRFVGGGLRPCYLCYTALSWATATTDHVLPAARGGADMTGNYRLACFPCNNRRGSELPDEAVLFAAMGARV